MVGEAGDNGRRPDVERSSAITIAADSPDEIVSHGLASRRRNFFVKVTYRPADQRGFRNHQLYLKLFCQRLTCAAWVEWSSFYIVQRIYKQLKIKIRLSFRYTKQKKSSSEYRYSKENYKYLIT